MALPQDPTPKFQEYARPEMLVSTEWLAEHLGDPGLVVAESDEDVLLYETGRPDVAVAATVKLELNAADPGACVPTVIVWFAFVASTFRVTFAAAL